MRLYTRAGQSAFKDPETGELYEADNEGGFEFPDDLGERLHRFHIGKQRQWEDEEQRHLRITSEEVARAQNPATLLAVVQQMADLVKASLPAQAAAAPVEAPAAKSEPADVPAPAKAPAKRAAKRTAPAPASE